MNHLWMKVLIFIIGLSAIVVEKPFIQGSFAHLEVLQAVPLFQTTALQNHGDKKSENKIHIAEDFIPIVLIADYYDPSLSFVHYIPIYNLYRERTYFLLI